MYYFHVTPCCRQGDKAGVTDMLPCYSRRILLNVFTPVFTFVLVSSGTLYPTVLSIS